MGNPHLRGCCSNRVRSILSVRGRVDMSIKEEKEKKIRKIGDRAESNTRMEIRVGFAKDVLIPKTMKVFKEIKERLSPMETSIHNGLSISLAAITGLTSIVNLGGITVWMEDGRKFSMYSGYDPEVDLVELIVVINPIFPIDDLFAAAEIYCSKPMPCIGMPPEFDGKKRNTHAVSLTAKRMMFIDEQPIRWPLVSGDSYEAYLRGITDCMMDLCSEICGKDE